MDCRSKLSLLYVAALVGLATASCQDVVGPEEPIATLPDVSDWVAGNALDHLDGDGHFVFPSPEAPGREPIISQEFAEELALAWVHTWPGNPKALLFGPPFGEEHGRPIDWSAVSLGPWPAYFAESPFQELSDTLPLWHRRFWGPQYVVPLYVGEVQVAALSVAAYGTDYKIDDRGFVVTPRESGNEFRVVGAPWTSEIGVPLRPEEAVAFVGRRTEARVIQLPVLIAPGRRITSLSSRWMLVLDRQISLINSETGGAISSDTVYARTEFARSGDSWVTSLELWVARPEQPTIDTTLGDNVPVRDDRPIDFLRVTLGGRSIVE